MHSAALLRVGIGQGGTAKWLAAGVLGGLLLRYFNLCRPIAAILVVALLLWLLFLEPKRLSDSGW